MLTIGIDPHKQTHSGVGVDPLGVQIAQRTVAARREGFGQLLEWARKLDIERVWVLEDVRHVSGPLERFLIDRGETVVRLPPRLMANARRGSASAGSPTRLTRWRSRGRRSERELTRCRQPGSPARSSRSGCWRYIANGSSRPGRG
jgi:transposase